MKRALMYASVASMIQQFNMDNIKLLKSLGYEVDVACNMKVGSTISDEKIKEMELEFESIGVKVYHIPVPRKVTAIGQILKSIKETKYLINSREYDLIHCHSPIGGMICRLANRISKTYGKARMIYTAHGFHFFEGAPKKNWLLFYPVEKLSSYFTDILITINEEDYALAQKKMKAKQVVYIPGVGVDLEKIAQVKEMRTALCQELGIQQDRILMLSVGELNDNKNHRCVVEVLNQLPEEYHYLICGQGHTKEVLEQLAKECGCMDRLHLMGFREDVIAIMKSCDMFLFPSKREGLSLAVMEAMACGMPCVVSGIRGNTDLIDTKGGMVLPVEEFGTTLAAYIGRKPQLDECRKYNVIKVKTFSKEYVEKDMIKIYRGE